MSLTLGADEAQVTITNNGDSGIVFQGAADTVEGTYLQCVVPAHEWFAAWDKLKNIKMESDIHQWSFIDESRKSMVLCESFVEFEKNTHQVKFTCRVVKLLHTKAFKDMKTFSENR
jgi:hypothetical protein